MIDRRRIIIEGRQGLCAKGWRVESRDNSVVLWCASSEMWREMENNRVNNEKLLVTKNNKRYRKICG